MISSWSYKKQLRVTSLKIQYLTSKYEASLDNKEMNEFVGTAENALQNQADLEFLKTRYFFSYAVGVKLNYNNQGTQVNVSIQNLYDDCIQQKIPLRDWNTWISETIHRIVTAPKPQESVNK